MLSNIFIAAADSLVKIVSTGYYAGFWSFVWREVPFSAIQMPFYELLRGWSLRKRKSESELTFLDNARNGALSGIIGKTNLTSIILYESDRCDQDEHDDQQRRPLRFFVGRHEKNLEYRRSRGLHERCTLADDSHCLQLDLVFLFVRGRERQTASKYVWLLITTTS